MADIAPAASELVTGGPQPDAPPPGRGVAPALAEAICSITGGPLPLRIVGWDGSDAGPATAPAAVLRSPDALRRLLWHPGELGAAQAYVTGDLEVEGDLADGLSTLLRAARRRRGATSRRAAVAATLRALRELRVDPRPLPAPASQARLRGRVHTRGRDRRAIGHHYDLSNDFYRLFLDEQMAYSCGYWTSEDPSYTLEDSQWDKLDLVCRKLGLRPGMRLLDVGCGWGALSIHAARAFGVRVVGITLSAEQRAFVRRRVRSLDLADLVDVRLQDYRDVSGTFDAVASLEMGEHVGRGNYPTFAQTLTGSLAPGGRALVQQMSRTGRHPGGGPFIESFIAPDMHMRPLGETVGLLERAGLEVINVESLRGHYVRTIAAWRDRLEDRWGDAVALVGEERARVFRLYLAGGQLAFRDGRMGVDQVLAMRPGAAAAAAAGGVDR